MLRSRRLEGGKEGGKEGGNEGGKEGLKNSGWCWCDGNDCLFVLYSQPANKVQLLSLNAALQLEFCL